MPYADPVVARERSAQRSRELRQNKEWNRERNAKWKAANREKYLAHKVVENAVKSGRLERRPCERCGSQYLVHAHHDDYSRPLDVMWLCPMHHRERHRELECSAVAA